MTASVIICDGATKSGSTLLFRITEAIFGDSIDFLCNLFHDKDSDCLEYYRDVPTGYVNNLPRLFDKIKDSSNSFPLDQPLVLKVHNFSLGMVDFSSDLISISHVYTIRNPLDNIKSLLEASAKEIDKRDSGLDYRDEFAGLNTANKAGHYLLNQYRFVIQEDMNYPLHLLEYPDYMNPNSSAFNKYCNALNQEPLKVQNACLDVDKKSRSGQIWTEFNIGLPGRGNEVANEIDQNLLAEINNVYAILQLKARS